MKQKTISLIMAALLVCTIAGCASTDNAGSTGDTSTPASADSIAASSQGAVSDSVVSLLAEKLKDEDLDSSWSAAASTQITLNGGTAAVSGSGAAVSGGTVTITKAGTYVLSGTLSKGQILISASENDLVRLVLGGVNITADANAAIYVKTADKLVIILADGTKNTITDAGAAFAYADKTAEEPDAAIFSKCDLSINGAGSLTVNAGFKNGIGTKDDLVIAGGDFAINAANDGLRGRDSVTIANGSFDITAGGDGIQSNNDEDATKGWITLSGGVYKITAVHDGIQAETLLSVWGGEYTVTSGVSSLGAASANLSDSYKGLKAGTDLTIAGGTFIIDSTDDSIHANGGVTITGGDFTIASGDDGIHADADLTVSSGNINISKSYEGIEGATVNISGGKINIVASDDGVNAAGGNEGGVGGRFGKDNFAAAAGSYAINISGGAITLSAGGDGLDSNGVINVTGGMVVSLIRSTADNGAVDCDGTFTATGGTIIYGGTGVGNVPGTGSTQSYAYVTGVSAGKEVTLQKGDNILIAFTPGADCQYLVLSSPDIVSGESYEVYSGGSLLATVTAGTGGDMGRGPGGMRGPGGQRP